MLILKTPTRGNVHGYGIAQLIQQTSGDEILVAESCSIPPYNASCVMWGDVLQGRGSMVFR